MPQPPYSPDLAPCDFFLFPKLKRPMKGRRYATIEEIKTASKEELNKITKNNFLKCFEDWKRDIERRKIICEILLARKIESEKILDFFLKFFFQTKPHSVIWQRNQEFQRQWSINVWTGILEDVIVGLYFSLKKTSLRPIT
ncbi:hypothetical protein ALC56_02425 [Trachymyrmex septentrionalis]|uniref:Histone-lysine N-methyltransferase SETMAR n=1 Tax=Trachymyrmex septentrionalis TaxID=34720 RepID=A0A151K175_9HYME|nr:hypothetical protein ALC56_02425 [Trachymyrmex septentrionalis]